uniref:Uncharacterized protein n=1 Tax=Ciona savignyi TaxID=51511 RepID=H2YWL1_CIOSA
MQRHKLLSHKIGFKKRPISRPTLVMPVSSNSDDTFNSFFGDGSSAVSAIGQSSNPLNTPGYGYKVPAIPLQNEPVPQSEIRASPNRVLWQRNLSSQSFPPQAIASSPSIQHQQRWPIITASSSLQEIQVKEQLRQKSSDLASVS